MTKTKNKDSAAVLDEPVSQPVTNDAFFHSLGVGQIIPDPNQPRRFFDQVAMDELTTSIATKGVLQPILVRPHKGDLYMLVCGERRFRAAKAAGLVEIPCGIRELSDEDALEIQIVENLQRKNVHPMEEAAGFKSLLDHKQLTIEEIAARVGKSIYYVRQRMKLNDLIPELQKLYFANRIKAVDALTLSGLNEEAQKDIAKDCDNEKGGIEFNNWYLRKYKGDLSNAPFRLDDMTLDQKMGACIGCRFNSATAALFPDAEKSPICGNIKCFSHKCDVHFDHELVKAKEDPGIIFLNSDYGDVETKLAKAFKKEGIDILGTGWNGECKMVEKPDAPVLDDYDIDDYDSEKDRMQDFNDDMAKYEKELQAYESKIAGGKYKKAFVVQGDEKGKYVYVTMNPKKASSRKKDVKAMEAAGELAISDIDDEIKRIQDREKRAKELDAEKVHRRIIEAVDNDPTTKKLPDSVEAVDLPLLTRYLIYDLCNYQIDDKLKRAMGVPTGYHPSIDKIDDYLKSMTDKQILFLLRSIAFTRFHSNIPLQPGAAYGAFVFRKMAETLGTIPIEAFETEQLEKAEKRQARVTKRLAELKEKKAELKKAQPTETKPKDKAKKKK